MDKPGHTFPVLNLQQLSDLPKGHKPQDMKRILDSRNSEDWVTWNFFQVLFKKYPTDWWRHIISVARRRNPHLVFSIDERALPTPQFWSSVPSPPEYEAQSRARMLASGNEESILRAKVAGPVEGPSEIDIAFDHDQFLVYIEAKLLSDVSMNTKYDLQRNQIIRNIDCLIANAGNRKSIFWLLVKDEAPTREYVRLINNYTADPSLLVHDLPHRDTDTLGGIAQNLTILLWNDFRELVCSPSADPETAAVQRELEHRISGSAIGV
jgi:hypothetical protein